MKLILDACVIINLINGEALHKVAQISTHKFYVSDNLLEQELLSDPQKLFTEALLLDNQIILLESDITLSEFSALKSKYNLGAGETECIALCKKHGFYIATDDRKARISAKNEIGENFVVGSLYILRAAVRIGIMTCDEAITSYQLMKKEGGFLPKVDRTYLCQ